MKKQRSVFISAILISMLFNGTSMAANQTVTSDIVGIVNIQKPTEKFIFVGCNFESSTNSTFQDFTEVTQFKASTTKRDADRIITVINAEDKRVSYRLYASTPAQWRKAKKFGTPNPAGIPMQTGQAVWLMSKPNEFSSFAFFGEVVKAPQQSIQIIQGWQLICFPFSCDINLQDLTATGGTASIDATEADRIYLWDHTNELKPDYAIFGLYQNSDGTKEWINLEFDDQNDQYVFSQTVVNNRIISIGEGFYYEAMNSFIWEIDNPYLEYLK